MPPKQKTVIKEAFDSIVFLGFVALISLAATGASAWEQRICGSNPSTQKTVIKKDALQSKIVLTSREAGF